MTTKSPNNKAVAAARKRERQVDRAKGARKILLAAKKLIADPKSWLKGDYATTKRKKSVAIFSEDAACFCSMGALFRARSDSYGSGAVTREKINKYNNACRALNVAIKEVSPTADNIVQFNDDPSTLHSDVIFAFNKAIRKTYQDRI